MDKARNLFDIVRSQLWLLPLIFSGLAAVLAILLISYGHLLGPDVVRGAWWLYSGEAETARQLLSSLLSGLMTMTSLVISVTFVILTLAANQLGPRLISHFMADRQIQAVLGLFIGTILYLILVLRTISDTLGKDGVPHLAISTGSLLTVICLMALLFYIHKVARLIIADNMIQALHRDLVVTVDEVLPGTPQEHGGDVARFAGIGQPVALGKVGHVQVIDYGALTRIAAEKDLRIDVAVRAGQYLLAQGDHFTIFSGADGDGTEIDDETIAALQACFTIGLQNTTAQDLEYSIRQLTEIAVRALSPGINDPFTAVAVIDRLAASYEAVQQRPLPYRQYHDDDGVLRLIVSRSDYRRMLNTGFRSIRQAGADQPLVLMRIAARLADLAHSVRTPDQAEALSEQLAALEQTVEKCHSIERDQAPMQAYLDATRQVLAAIEIPPAGNPA
jgi:uncharacterized membrane protein